MRRNLEGLDSFLSLDNFKKILKSGSFRYVGLHGWGEPLLNPEVFNMVEYAESEGVYTNLTTNGTLVKENIDNILGSGLREIAFGIYHKKILPTVLPQIEELIKERGKQGFKIPKIYMDITIYKENLSQIPDLVEIASKRGIDAVILHRLFNAYHTEPDMKYISTEEEKKLFMKVKKLARKRKLKLYLPTKHSLPCKVVKNSIFVNVEGNVTPCCFLPKFYIGNALKEKIRDIICSDTYTNFVRNMSEHPICSKCRW